MWLTFLAFEVSTYLSYACMQGKHSCILDENINLPVLVEMTDLGCLFYIFYLVLFQKFLSFQNKIKLFNLFSFWNDLYWGLFCCNLIELDCISVLNLFLVWERVSLCSPGYPTVCICSPGYLELWSAGIKFVHLYILFQTLFVCFLREQYFIYCSLA